MAKRVVITGVAVNTPIGDTLDGFLAGLLSGRSAITRWKGFATENIYSKLGADLSDYDPEPKLRALGPCIPEEVQARARRFLTKGPWSTGLSVLMAVDAYHDAGLFRDSPDPSRVANVVAGHNLNSNYRMNNTVQFQEDPEYIDPRFALTMMDTDHPASIAEAVQALGAAYTVGAACASGNAALRLGFDEVRHRDAEVALVTGAVWDWAPIEAQGMALLGAMTIDSFNDQPQRASRPFDVRREGFVPAHGGATLVLEDLDHARARGARIYAEVLGVEASAAGNHLPNSSEEAAAACMTKVLASAGVRPEEVDFVSAHATSTPNGDVTEIRAVKRVFGAHAQRLRVNAPKSMLGHTSSAAAVVESAAAVLQMRAGQLHPSINIDQLDPEVDLDVCRGGPVRADVRTTMKNAFGFGGLSSISLLRRWDGDQN